MKKTFRISALLLVFVMAFSVIAFAGETESDKTEKMLKTVKSRIGDTSEYNEFSSNFYEGEYGTEYSFSWNNYETNKSMYVNVNESGIITYYYTYENSTYSEKPSFKKISREEAAERTAEFIKRINPDIAGEYAVTKENNYGDIKGTSYHFTAKRYHGGYEVENQDADITYDTETDSVTNYYLSYNPGLKFDPSGKVISNEQARESFTENFGLELCYTENDGKIEPYYIENSDYNEFIGATDGKPITRIYPNYGAYNDKYARGAITEMAADESEALTPQEKERVEEIEGCISAEEAQKIITSCKAFNLKGYELKNITFEKMYGEEANVYYLTFRNSKRQTVSASVSAQDGIIKSYSKYVEREAETKIDEAKLTKMSDTALKNIRPDIFTEQNRENGFAAGEVYGNSVTYERYANGIRFVNDTINLSLDSKSGEVYSFNINYTEDAEFPSLEGVISEKEAAEIIFEKGKYSPMYILSCSNDKLTEYDCAKLVYVFAEPGGCECNAFTGECPYLVSKEKENGNYTDLDSHWSKTYADKLREAGIGFASETLEPEKEMAQKDFVAFLSMLYSYQSPSLIDDNYSYDYAYESAKREGIIKKEEENRDAAVTREFAAIMITRALGFEEVASLDGIYKPLYSDVSEHVGAISVITALKVCSGDGNGHFYPKNTLTKAEAMVFIYNLLAR